MLSTKAKLLIAWCILLAMFAAGGAATFLQWSNVPAPISGLAGLFVLYSAGYFLIRGAECHYKEKRLGRCPKCCGKTMHDPLAPL